MTQTGKPVISAKTNKTKLYVRLSPTVLFPAPSCYGQHKRMEGSEKCWLCAVGKRCRSGQSTEER